MLTFLPPEEVLSGFADSPFSLLEDLGLFFSFSAGSAESEEGLALLLFLEESGREDNANVHI